MSSWHIRAMAAAAMAMGAGGMVFLSFSITLPLLAKDLNLGLGQAMIYASLNALVGAVSMAVLAPAALRRFGIRAVVGFGGAWTALVLVLTSLVNSLPMLVLLGAALGLTLPTCTNLAATAIVNIWFAARRGTMLGIVLALAGGGGIATGVFLPRIVEGYGWRVGFVVLGVATAALLVLPAIFLLRSRPEDVGLVAHGSLTEEAAATTPVLGIRAALAFRTPQFAALAIGLVGLNAIQAMQQHLAPIFAEHGLALIAAGTLISLLAFVNIPSTLATGVLNDRIGPLRTVTISTVLLVIGLLILHLTSGYGPMAAFIVLLSPSAVMGPVLTSILVRHVFGTRDFVRLLGPLMATMPAGIALGTVLWGVVSDATGSYDLGIVISMGAAVVCLALITYALTTGRPYASAG